MAFDYICEQSNDNYPDILILAADYFDSIGNNSRSLEILEKMMGNEAVNNEELWLKAGILYKKIGDQESAVDAFNSVLEKNPNNTEAKLHLSNLYLEKGEKNEALEILEGFNDEVFLSDEEGVYFFKTNIYY